MFNDLNLISKIQIEKWPENLKSKFLLTKSTLYDIISIHTRTAKFKMGKELKILK